MEHCHIQIEYYFRESCGARIIILYLYIYIGIVSDILRKFDKHSECMYETVINVLHN